MTKRNIEFFVLVDCSGEYNTTEAEYFDTFEEARSHINDTNEHGNFKYHGWWTDAQECEIKRIIITPEYKLPKTTDIWAYRNGRLDETHSYHYENAYQGKVR